MGTRRTLKLAACAIALLVTVIWYGRDSISLAVQAASRFPTIRLSYMNTTGINPQAISYQMADYDAKRNQVLFYPYGSVTRRRVPSGILLTYNLAKNNFTSPASWTAIDLTRVVSADAADFAGGFLDTQDNFAYLVPGAAQRVFSRQLLAVRVDLAKEHENPNDPSAYTAMDLRTLPGSPDVGGFSGIFAGGFGYIAPTGRFPFNGALHGNWVRFNGSQNFSSAGSWEWFDLYNLASPPDPSLGGSQSMAYLSPYVYIIPFSYGRQGARPVQASKLIRYDTTKNFRSPTSYETFDLAGLPFPPEIQGQLKGFTGGVVVGSKLVLVPWGMRDTRETESVALLFDTAKPLKDPGAWQYIDLRNVNPKAGGYQFGWLDKDGFVWFVPTHNYNAASRPMVPPFVAWNSKLPFNNPGSWMAYANNQAVWSTGAAYDPNTNTAWFSPYGEPASGITPLITQLHESF